MSDDLVRAAALKAAGKFRFYEQQHTEKADRFSSFNDQDKRADTLRKAAVNKAMAEELEGALGVGPQPALIDVDSTSKPQL